MEEERKTSLDVASDSVKKALEQMREDAEDNPLLPQHMLYIRMIAELMPTAVIMLGAINDKISVLTDINLASLSSEELTEDEDEEEFNEEVEEE